MTPSYVFVDASLLDFVFSNHCLQKDKIETDIAKDSIFHKLGEKGLISFSDYLFLMTVLASK